MTRRPRLIAGIVAALTLIGFGGLVVANDPASAAAPANACDTAYPSTSNTGLKIDRLKAYTDCRADRIEDKIDSLASAHPAQTVTVTVTPPASSPPASSPPASSPPASSSSPPPSSPAGCVKPTAANTGATGTRTSSSASTLNTNGQVLENVDVPGDLIVNADNVTIRNVQTGGGILVNVSAVGTMIDRVTTEDIGLSSPDDVTIQYTRITASDEHDALHVTGDSGRRVSNVVIRNSLVDDPRPQGAAHYDGLQIRGVNGLLVQCNTFDLGPWQEQFTAAIYSEPANGGNTGVRVLDNWISGGGYAIYAESGNEFSRNRFGSDQRWGICYGNGATPSGSGNVRDADNSPVDLATECAA